MWTQQVLNVLQGCCFGLHDNVQSFLFSGLLIYKTLFKRDILQLSNSPVPLTQSWQALSQSLSADVSMYYQKRPVLALLGFLISVSWTALHPHRLSTLDRHRHYRVCCPFFNVSQKLLWEILDCFFADLSDLRGFMVQTEWMSQDAQRIQVQVCDRCFHRIGSQSAGTPR